MKVARILLALSAMGCAANSIGGSSTSTTQVNGVGGVVANLTMITDAAPVTRALAVTPEKAWAQVPSVYAELGIPLSFMVAESRIAGNQGVNLHRQLAGTALRQYFLCGDASGGPNADTYTITVNVATQIQPDGAESAKAATVLDATATPMSSGSNSVHCGSTGDLERRINDLIAKRLGLN